MSLEQNQATFARFAEIWNTGDTTALEECVGADYVRHDASQPVPVRGPEALQQLIGFYRSVFADLHFTANLVVANDEFIAVILKAQGTHQGELMGIAPTGKSVQIQTCDFYRFENGKIVEQWVQVDNLGLLQQLGAVPMPG